MNLGLLHCECRVLATGPPGKSLNPPLFIADAVNFTGSFWVGIFSPYGCKPLEDRATSNSISFLKKKKKQVLFNFWPHPTTCGMDLSSLTRDPTHTSSIGKWSFNHWTTREVPNTISVCYHSTPHLLNTKQMMNQYLLGCMG